MCAIARQPWSRNLPSKFSHNRTSPFGVTMTRDDDLRIRLGRVRDGGRARRAKPFIAQALAAAEKAGGFKRRSGHGVRSSTFGRGRAASFAAARRLTDRSRGAMVKARVVRHGIKRVPLSAHLEYLRRDGVTKDRAAGRMFDAQGDSADYKEFAERCAGDRHHFRFIVSPDDAEQLSDLKAFTRDLMGQAERDLGTKLDWVAVDHWNTEHPHVHVIVRGVTDNEHDLVISRDYISQGLRARAGHLVTIELEPRTDLDIRRRLAAEIEPDRWTGLDRVLAIEATVIIALSISGRKPIPPWTRHPVGPGRANAQAGAPRAGRAAGVRQMVSIGTHRADVESAWRAQRHHQAYSQRTCRA